MRMQCEHRNGKSRVTKYDCSSTLQQVGCASGMPSILTVDGARC